MVTCPGEREMQALALMGGREGGGVRIAARIPCGLDINQRPQTPTASQSARHVKDTHLKNHLCVYTDRQIDMKIIFEYYNSFVNHLK